MVETQKLLERLDEIGQALDRSGHALALIGLGSVGLELGRLDEYSDLDFFAIVEPGYKTRYIQQLDWLESIRPVVYRFLNTPDGYKLMFDDGVFCEFAVFEPAELEAIAFSPGRVVWKRPGVDDGIAAPRAGKGPSPRAERPAEWLVGEALTNLYVGLGRYRRGEKLSAQRFVQHYAVDRIVELAARLEPEQPAWRDGFAEERRFEQRFPGLAQHLRGFIGGYDHTPASALAILAFLERHFEINPALAQAVRDLAGD